MKMDKLKLSNVDLSLSLDKKDYKEKMKELDVELLTQQLKVRDKKKRVAILVEGWDAAGKGGAIKRITKPMDPRGYKVHMISKPTEYELARNYMWRFWIHMPTNGEISIFDRTWYGRVLVERIEGFASHEAWQRAYEEINNFEKMIMDNGTMIVKLFFHISKDEQGKRFKEREENPLKQYKIGDEDARNRARWDDYIKAYDDMFAKTNTDTAPWNIIPANDKRYARVNSIEILLDKLKQI